MSRMEIRPHTSERNTVSALLPWQTSETNKNKLIGNFLPVNTRTSGRSLLFDFIESERGELSHPNRDIPECSGAIPRARHPALHD